MAKAVINLQKESGGITKISSADGTGVTELVVPESGNLVSVNTAVTDNSIARYDGTTGKLQNSGVFIDDSGNVGIGATPSAWAAGWSCIDIGNTTNIFSAGNQSNFNYNAYFNGIGEWKFKSNGYSSQYSQNGGYHMWASSTSHGLKDNAVTWNNTMTLDANGNLLLQSGTGALGYGEGAGGIVTQLTSRDTSVTLNKPCGTIITSNLPLAPGATVSFIVYNHLVTIADLVYVYGGAYSSSVQITADNTTDENGKFNIRITNNSGYNVPYVLHINFAIIKGARA